ncbi:unnamed protein product [Cochlearia groenlandica]
MQQNSFFMGCNYTNRDRTYARTSWSLCPVQDIGSVLTNRYNENGDVKDDDTLSLLYYDLYLRQLKETLKHTMLVHESVFESQIHELHRLYWRQKELMMGMEETRHHEALYLNSTFPSHRTHWMSSCVSTYQTMNQTKAVDNVEKVLDLELPDFGYHDRGEESSLMCGEFTNFLKEESLESGHQSSKLLLDLNEPAKTEEDSEHVSDQFLSPVISNEIGENSAKVSNSMNEPQGQIGRGCGIDLNMSPLLSEELVNIVKKFETEKPQECLSASLSSERISEQSRVIVQALPCLNSILLLNKPFKSLMRRSSRPRKKIKLGPVNKTSNDSDLDLHSTAQATSESQRDQAIMRKGSSSYLSKVKSARNRTEGERRRCKPQMQSNKGHEVVAKKKRKRSRKISLVTDQSYLEISAAEAIVDMSRKSCGETSDCIDSLGIKLLWLAEIASSVVKDDCELDYFEARTLQQTEIKLKDHKTVLRSKDNKTTTSSIVLVKQRRSMDRQVKLQHKGDQRGDNTFSECEANEVKGKLSEASESKWDRGLPTHKSKSSPAKRVDAFPYSVEAKPCVDWGATKKRKRGSRIPAADFQHMVSSAK